MPSPNEALLARARAARARAYAPYSHFAVGAAVETVDGDVFEGCNVENASYGLSICAERVALASAVAAGHRHFRAIAVAGPEGALTSPCGACRQFVAEFGEQIEIVFTGVRGDERALASELLPHGFGAAALES